MSTIAKWYVCTLLLVFAAGCTSTTPIVPPTPAPVGTISGIVRDTTGKPLKGVSVNLEVTNYLSVATTDSSGIFHFANVTPGTYPIYAAMSRFSSDTESITITADHNSTVNFIIYRTAPAVPIAGLLCYYPFDGNTQDSTANHHDGYNSGVTFAPDRFNQDNGSARFYGAATISVPDSPDLNFGDSASFTIACWINPSSLTSAYPVQKGSGGSPGYSVYLTNSVAYGYFIGNIGSTYIEQNVGLTQAVWTFVAFVVDGRTHTGTAWINGISGATTPLTQLRGSMSNTSPLVFGMSYIGMLDDVRIYNRALSDDEVLDLYHENGW